jgi:hypothetical protein
MLPAMRGTLVSECFAESILAEEFAGRVGESSRDEARRILSRCSAQAAARLGPASSVRMVFDVAALPLALALGFTAGQLERLGDDEPIAATLVTGGRVAAVLLVAGWGENLDASWRQAVHQGILADARWCFCCNARELRLTDTRRSWSRRYVQFDLAAASDDERAFAALWALFRAAAFEPIADSPHAPPLVEQIVESSARHGVMVCRALRTGVLEALRELLAGFVAARRGGSSPLASASLAALHEQTLTLVYRILFLLFAEARGLVPMWHRVYRESYSIEALRARAERGERPRGMWEALQAIGRLAHAGCEAGDIRVTPFNGRLFSPSRTPLGESGRLDDGAAARALLALSTRRARAGRERIAYRDLGVEQLGSVYESVLDYEPHVSAGGPPGVRLEPGPGRRKATGTFYTPASITEFLVRRTLHPIVATATPDEILRVRVLDPAMGSGAFLVAACRYLAGAYEAALVRHESCHATDIDDGDRARFRRTIAQQCLFGVDLNPMAVQLARLSLWLATLASDRPLTFLDHRLVVGDSLLGASLEDLARQPPGGKGRRATRSGDLPLIDDAGLRNAMQLTVPARTDLALRPGDTVAEVRAKEQTLVRLASRDAALSRWKQAADLWCAGWFWPPSAQKLDRRTYAALVDQILGDRRCLPPAQAAALLDTARAVAGRHRFFHWTLEFPEVFYDAEGGPLHAAGFDAVVGNPPWDMLRADTTSPEDGDESLSHRAVRFARDSGVYSAQSNGHANRFQLFLERALALTRPGGRLGLVLPWGLAADAGCASLRRLLLHGAATDTLVGFDNARAIFPIHRSVRFLLFTATTRARTDRIQCRLGVHDATTLDGVPDDPAHISPVHFPLVLSPGLLERISGPDLAVPDVRHPMDLALLVRLTERFPALSATDGWKAQFGRELNASDDRDAFAEDGDGVLVVEGKHVDPFHVRTDRCRFRVPHDLAATRVDPGRTYRRPRLAYRDVASATNRLTLIAAIVPRGCLTTHTLFCLKSPLADEEQAFLCGVFNSLAANYLVRLRVTTHVSLGIIDRLPVPKPSPRSRAFMEVSTLSSALARDPADRETSARLQAVVARLYGLSLVELDHVLATFPLIEEEDKLLARAVFQTLAGSRER